MHVDIRLTVLSRSICFACSAMYAFDKHNKAKIEQCKAEGIEASRLEEFKSMGNESPLFR